MSEDTSDKNINEQLKARIDQIDFDTKIAQVREGAAKAFGQIKEQAGSLLEGNRTKVDEVIVKATSAFDDKTEGKYHDKVEKARASFASGLDKIQDASPGSSAADPAADPTTDTATDAPVEFPAAGHVGVEEPVIDTPEEPVDPTAWSAESDRPS